MAALAFDIARTARLLAMGGCLVAWNAMALSPVRPELAPRAVTGVMEQGRLAGCRVELV